MARAPSPGSDSVAVIGLGRFGGAVAEALVRLGHDVLGIDEDAELVQSWADRLTHVVQADTTSGDTLRRLGVRDFDRAVVGIGSNIEASVLTVLALSDLGVRDIWAKALSRTHHRILTKLGADRVIHPEQDVGQHIAQMLHNPLVRDYLSLGNGYYIIDLRAPETLHGKTLDTLNRANIGRVGLLVKTTDS